MIFLKKILAEDFSLYLHRPTATDKTMAPKDVIAFTFYHLCQTCYQNQLETRG